MQKNDEKITNHSEHYEMMMRDEIAADKKEYSMSKKKSLQIRNSTAEFLIFTNQSGEETVEVRFQIEFGMAYSKADFGLI